MTPHDFAHKLEQLYEGNLESVILFGSAAGGDFSKKHSDFNIIVILKDLSPVNLAKAGKLVHKWVKKGNPVPHFFDTAHIEQSLDVFPLEFLDISERHQVLFGINPFKDIKIDKSNLRHQCESELKGKLLDMRAIYIMNYDRPKHISEIMLRTFPSFISVFRGVIHLLGDEPERETRKVIEQMAKHIDFNPQVFMDLIAVREGKMLLPRKDEAVSAFENYLTEIQTITNYVDRLT
jgi:predicted nucleotidyltransferase